MNQLIFLTQRVHDLEIQLDNIHRFKVSQRLACELKKAAPHGENTYTLNCTKGTLALRMGIEAETLSRNLERLNDHGIRIVDKSVDIYDRGKSRRSVCDLCAAAPTCRSY